MIFAQSLNMFRILSLGINLLKSLEEYEILVFTLDEAGMKIPTTLLGRYHVQQQRN